MSSTSSARSEGGGAWEKERLEGIRRGGARRRKDWRALEGEGLGEGKTGGHTSLCMQYQLIGFNYMRGYHSSPCHGLGNIITGIIMFSDRFVLLEISVSTVRSIYTRLLSLV